VRDKDGISAALVVCALGAELDAQGKSLLDRLDEIAVRFGLFESAQRSVVLPGRDGVEHMARIMAELRREPPSELAGHVVAALVDCQTGRRHVRAEPPVPIELPASNVLVFELDGGHRVIARPSGTEPKIKFYFDVREPVAEVSEVGAARARARQRLAALEQALLARVGLAS
jgi:phosphomannomutase